MKRLELFFTAILVPLDIVAVVISLMLAYYWRSHGQMSLSNWPLRDYIAFSIYTIPVWLTAFATSGLYRTKPAKRGFDELSSIILGTLYSWALIIVMLYFIRTDQTRSLPRKLLIYLPFLTIIITTLLRNIHHAIETFLYRFQIGTRRVLLIGRDNDITSILISHISNTPNLGLKLVKTIDSNQIDDLAKIQEQYRIDDIILADSNLQESKVSLIIQLCEDRNIIFRQIPNVYDVQSVHMRSTTIGSIPLIEFTYTPLEGWGHIAKRFIDIIGSTIALIIFAIPMLLISLIIKIDSHGPILYKHERIGRDGKKFFLYKFRSMVIDAEAKLKHMMQTDPQIKEEFQRDYKLKKDPRITRIGQLLRKTSLDELPQFFNSFLGDLSLVGPRPIVSGEMDKYGIYQHKRHIIRPGITGLWQISGRNDVAYEERIKLDLYYIHNWSFWLDLSIIIKTFLSLLKRNAY